MAYYNHFANRKYKSIPFSSVAIGEKFREDKFKNKRRRRDIICVKTGELSYIEFKSKKETKLFGANFEVSHFSELASPTEQTK